jgi:hypothetical protein
VEPDYYRKAVAYDSTLAQERHDAQLGWQLTATTGGLDPAGTRSRGAGGSRWRPLAGAVVTSAAIHNLDAGRVIAARLVTAGRPRLGARGAGPRGASGSCDSTCRLSAEHFTTELTLATWAVRSR